MAFPLDPNSPAGQSRDDAIRASRARQSVGGRGGVAMRRAANTPAPPTVTTEYVAAGLDALHAHAHAHYGRTDGRR